MKRISIPVLSVLLLVPAPAHAYFTNSQAFFEGGFRASTVANLQYYEYSSVANLGYSYYTANARSDYASISYAAIAFYGASDGTNAHIKFYAGNYGLDYYGIAVPYKREDTGWTQAYDWEPWGQVRIKLNDGAMDYAVLSTANRHETTIHELGHALSLVHQPDGTNSIMEETDLDERRDPTSLDIGNLQWKY